MNHHTCFKAIHWSIIDLQRPVSFCHTAKWLVIRTHTSSLLKIPSPRVSLEYWAEFPVLISGSLLVIYFMYSKVYMPVSVFWFIHPFHPTLLCSLWRIKLLWVLSCHKEINSVNNLSEAQVDPAPVETPDKNSALVNTLIIALQSAWVSHAFTPGP